MKVISVDSGAKRITLDLRNVPAAEIFEQISRAASIPIEMGSSPGPGPNALREALPATVYSIHLENENFWPAVMSACDVTHLHVAGSAATRDGEPEPNGPPLAIVIMPANAPSFVGWGRRPICASDEGVVVASSMTPSTRIEYADEQPASKGQCEISLGAYVDPTRFAVPVLPPTITSVTDEQGNVLPLSNDPTPMPGQIRYGMPGQPPRPYVWSVPIRLGQAPVHGRIAELKGSVEFVAAKSRAEFEVDDVLQAGPWIASADEFSVDFTPVEPARGGWSVCATLNRKQSDNNRWKLIVQQFKLGLRGIQLLDEASDPYAAQVSPFDERQDRIVEAILFCAGAAPSTRPATQPAMPKKLRWSFIDSETSFRLPFDFKDLDTP